MKNSGCCRFTIATPNLIKTLDTRAATRTTTNVLADTIILTTGYYLKM